MWFGLIIGLAVVALLAILFVPRMRNGDDAPLPTEVETLLLLGEDPDEVALRDPESPSPSPSAD
jgi:hypothetical protein